jgi:hypothetical protein
VKHFKKRAALGLFVLGSLIPLTFAGSIVAAGPPAVPLGTADSYAVLAGDTITNTGATTINGDLGLHPGTSVTGSPTVNGTSNVANGAAQQAKADLRTAYLDAEGRPGAILVPAGALGGRTLAPGLYKDDGAPASLGIATGQTLTLAGDASSVWIFQSASTLITETGSRVVLSGGALACNVFWQVGSSATLKTSSTFVGTVLAHVSIAAQNSVTVEGRLLAGAQANGAGALTMDTDTITKSHCLTAAEATAAAEAAAAEAARVEAARVEAARVEAARVEAARVVAARNAVAKAAAAKKVAATKKAAAAKKAAATRRAAAAPAPRPAGGSTSVRGPALPPVNTAGFTG